MLNLDAVRTLTRHGYEMPAILSAMNAAETAGSADLDGWTIRYNERGEMITVHPSWCGIYVGDYAAHIIFQKNLSYRCGKYGYNAVLESLLGIGALTVALPAVYAVVLVALSVVITMIGGLLPAKRAAKQDAVIALRTE